jgi:hypothetical protein
VGEAEEHGDDKGLFCCEHAWRASHEVDVGLLVVEGVRLGPVR